MITAREEMRVIMAKTKVSRALKRAVPRSADVVFCIGDQVLVFREEPEGFSGPFTDEHVDGKTVSVIDGTLIKPFSRAQVKHYRRVEIQEKGATELVSNVGRNVSKDFQMTHITEIIPSTDNRARDPRMREAKKREIKGLLARGTFKIVLKSEISHGANKLGGRYVCGEQISVYDYWSNPTTCTIVPLSQHPTLIGIQSNNHLPSNET
jgi:hypothetical protein